MEIRTTSVLLSNSMLQQPKILLNFIHIFILKMRVIFGSIIIDSFNLDQIPFVEECGKSLNNTRNIGEFDLELCLHPLVDYLDGFLIGVCPLS